MTTYEDFIKDIENRKVIDAIDEQAMMISFVSIIESAAEELENEELANFFLDFCEKAKEKILKSNIREGENPFMGDE